MSSLHSLKPFLFTFATPFMFFTGKGGVGKTSLACATAVKMADAGRSVLLVSTDPASNLDEMLGISLYDKPRLIPSVPLLSAMNVNPVEAAEAYRKRVLEPYKGISTAQELSKMREELSGACTVEVAAFDEFAGLLGDDRPSGIQHVIFDTAPTGHTLRLLSLPRAWSQFLNANAIGASCLGPHSGLKMRQDRFSLALESLSNSMKTTVAIVSRPESSSFREAARTSLELRNLGLNNQILLINGVFAASDRADSTAIALEGRGDNAFQNIPETLKDIPQRQIELRSFNTVGINQIRELSEPATHDQLSLLHPTFDVPRKPLMTLVDEIASAGHGVILVMGKGGVGKTTVACAVALELARRGFPTKLSTTDPAAHLSGTLEGRGIMPANLEVSRIDPQAEVEAYKQKIRQRKAPALDAEGMALLEEDLRSPCTEEVAVFHAFSHLVSEGRKCFVVLDTAPTGHSLLLLDASGSYHREALRGLPEGTKITTPLMRLQDANFTKVLLVTLAETTPVSEAAQLQDDLRRAKIEPFAWIVNSVLAATGTRDPLLVSRMHSEVNQIERINQKYASKSAIIPWKNVEPRGPNGLLDVLL
jgi:arsenite-transporting ATPase